jgi:HK97 family phage prohead protease
MVHQKRGGHDLKTAPMPFEIKATDNDGGFEGYASTMDLDRGGDIVAMGAFDRSLAEHRAKGTRPKMLWQHDPDRVIGVWDLNAFRQDDKGLHVRGRCLRSTTLGADAYELLKAGAIDSMSIGYMTKDAEFEDGDTRRLKEVDLWEISLVTFPMNPEARITAVKRVESVRDVEHLLREGGVPGAFAKLVALHGFEEAQKRVNGGRRDGADNALTEKLEQLRQTLGQRTGA